MLPWPNILSKWADGLGQVHCQYGTFAKLCISCPCEVEFKVVLFFFEGDWYLHKIAVWECFDIGTCTRRISSHVLACYSMKRIGHRILLLLSLVRIKSFVNASGCLFVLEENESRVFCLSPTGWIVSMGAAEEELRPFKFCAKIWSTRGSKEFSFFSGILTDGDALQMAMGQVVVEYRNSQDESHSQSPEDPCSPVGSNVRQL